MQALERCEKLYGAFHIEARSVVSHAKDSFVLFLQKKRNPGVRMFGCELPCIAQQVFQRDLDKPLVARRREPFGNFDYLRARRSAHAEVLNKAGIQLREID